MGSAREASKQVRRQWSIAYCTIPARSLRELVLLEPGTGLTTWPQAPLELTEKSGWAHKWRELRAGASLSSLSSLSRTFYPNMVSQICSPKKKAKASKQTHQTLQNIILKVFADKGPCSQIYGFSSSHVWMRELDYKESWALKNWCFWTMVWRRLLRVPWTARRSNQSILKEINPEYSLGLMLKLKVQYFGHLMWRTNVLKNTLMLRKIEGWRRRGRQKIRWLNGVTNSMDMNLGKLRDG